MNAPLAVRQEFGAQQTTTAVLETSVAAAAAQAKAMVEARYVMAMQRPRNWDVVRQNVMLECRRPAFASNQSAYYRKPVGKGVEGLGIRFVEVALRCMTNVLIEPALVFEDEMKELHRISVTDIESNLTYFMDLRLSKTVERSKPMDDGSFISRRKNSFNKWAYTVIGNDDDLLNKRGALLSKAIRTLGLRIIPGDIQDEAIKLIKDTRLNEDARDPGAARKAISDAFADIGVRVADLTEYIGHSLDTCSPAELSDLRAMFGAIKDGEATWQSFVDHKADNQGSSTPNPSERAGQESPPKVEANMYPDVDFQKNRGTWKQMVESGRKLATNIINQAQTKGLMTEAQKNEITSWAPQKELANADS